MRGSEGSPILLIEDTPSLQLVYVSVLRNKGYDVITAETAAEGLEIFGSAEPCVTILDLTLPDRSGLELLKECLSARPDAHFIVIAAAGSIDLAVEAMRAGAYEYLVKPFDEQRMLNAIQNAKADVLRMRSLRGSGGLHAPLEGFIGSSAALGEVYSRIRSVGRSMATVFISGESGTGKDLCAKAVHDHSNRAAGPYIPLNCGAVSLALLESEIFGHLRGSITGANADKLGAAAAADGGTLFLDEICEMDLNLQGKLLRFLQTSNISPVGSTKQRRVNVRILCATSRDPVEEVRRGRFRQDLFNLLNVVPIHLPTLRERGSDILEVAEAALQRYSKEEGKGFTEISGNVKELFLNHSWPGNVRQLLTVMRNIIALNDGPRVSLSMLPPELLNDEFRRINQHGHQTQAPMRGEAPSYLIGKTLAEIEEIVIEQTITHHGGSVPKAARTLGVSPSTVYRKRESWQRRGKQTDDTAG